MYKDVWKRVLAVAVTVCLVVTFVQWPTTVRAEEGKTYHLYQHGGGDGEAELVNARRAAAVFTVGQNEDGNAEILESATFDIHVEEGTDSSQTKATVAYYLRPDAEAPDLGMFVCSDQAYGLVEGTNRIDLNPSLMEMEPGMTFAIIVTLMGEGLSFYADQCAEAGKTYVDQEDGTWKDMASEESALNIRAITYDVEEEEVSIITHLRSALSKSSADVTPVSADAESVPSNDNADGAVPDAAAPPAENSPAETPDVPDTPAENPPVETPPAENPPVETPPAENPPVETPPVENPPVETPDVPSGEPDTPVSPETPDVPSENPDIPADPVVPEQPAEPTEQPSTEQPAVPPVDTEQPPSTEEVPPAGNIPSTEEVPSTEELPSTEVAPPAGETPDGAPADTESQPPAGNPADTESTEQPGSETPDTGLPDTGTSTGDPADTEGGATESETPEIPSEEPAEETETPADGTEGEFSTWAEDGASATADPSAPGIELSANTLTVGVGYAVQLTLLTGGKDGVQWTSADPAIAEIEPTADGSGLRSTMIRGKSTGTTTVTATYLGETYACTVIVTDEKTNATVSFKGGATAEYDGEPHEPELIVIVDGVEIPKGDYVVQCTYTNRLDGQQSATNLDYIGAGLYHFEISGIKNTNLPANTSIPGDFVINPKSINGPEIKTEINWNAAKPSGSQPSQYLTLKDEAIGTAGTTLVSGKDYDISATDPVKVSGKGNYYGELQVKKPLSLADATIEFTGSGSDFPDGSCIYTGKAREPGVIVKLGGDILSLGRDYTIQYFNNKDAGEPGGLNSPTVKVVGTGNDANSAHEYYEEKTVQFRIARKKMDNSDNTATFPEKVLVNITAGRDPAGNLIPVEDIRYFGMKLEENKDYRVTRSTGSCTIEGLTNFEGTITVQTNVSEFDIGAVIKGIIYKEYLYTGAPIRPDATGTLELEYYTGKGPLSLGRDYTISFSNNVNAGSEVKAVIMGTGSYSGTMIIDNAFNILPVDLGDTAHISIELATGGKKIFYSPFPEDLTADVAVRFDSDDQAVGQVLLTPVQDYLVEWPGQTPGSKTVTIKTGTSGNFTGTATQTYVIDRCELQEAKDLGRIVVEVRDRVVQYDGTQKDPGITVWHVSKDGQQRQKLDPGTDYKIEYSPNCVDRGMVEAHIVGTGNYTGSLLEKFEIRGKSIEDCTVLTNTSNAVNSGNVASYKNGLYMAMLWFDDQKELAVEVRSPEGVTLTEGVDYQLSYENTGKMSSSSACAKVHIEGIGEYFGRKSYGYLLAKKMDECTLTIPTGKPVYTGSEIHPQGIRVKVGTLGPGWFGSTLQEGVDYWLEYQNATDSRPVSGTDAKVTVKAMDMSKLPTANGCVAYAAGATELSGTFEIKQAPLDGAVLAKPITKVLEGAEVTLDEGEISLTFNGIALAGGKGTAPGLSFEIPTADDTYSKNDRVTTDASVKVQGKGNFTGWKRIQFEIRGKQITNPEAFEIAGPVTYNGKRQEPEVKVHYQEPGQPGIKDLVPGDDYTCSYKDNLNAGTASVTVTGVGQYAGLINETLTFEILPRDIGSHTQVENVDAKVPFTSQDITFKDIRVRHDIENGTNYKELTSADYSISYENNRNAGKNAAVVVRGTGNYTGIYRKTFEIEKKSIAAGEPDITVFLEETYGEDPNGQAVKPVPVIRYEFADGEYYYLTTPADFTLTYENNYTLSEGNYNKDSIVKIEASSNGNFTGNRDEKFRIGINIADESKVRIDWGDLADKIFNGEPIEPDVRLYRLDSDNPQGPGAPLEKDKDYTVECKNNVGAGKVEVIVKGKGLYGGTVTKSFNILQKDISQGRLVVIHPGNGSEIADGSYKEEYTGQPITPEIKVYLEMNGTVIDVFNDPKYKDEFRITWGNNIDVTSTRPGNEYVLFSVDAVGRNFTGTIDSSVTPAAKFQITPRSIGAGFEPASGFRVSEIVPQPLVNGVAEPVPRIFFRKDASAMNRELVAGTDFTCRWENNTVPTAQSGKDAEVVVTGIGNYKDTFRIKFKIQASINNAVIKPVYIDFNKEFVNNDADKTMKPLDDINKGIQAIVQSEIEVYLEKNPDGTPDTTKPLDKAKYEVKCAGFSGLGAVLVTITPTKTSDLAGVCQGFAYVQGKLDKDNKNITISVAPQIWTGQEIKPIPTVKFYDWPLAYGTHFIVSRYENNTDASTVGKLAEVYIKAATGVPIPILYGDDELMGTFEIQGTDKPFTVNGLRPSYKFRGVEIEPAVTVSTGNTVLRPGTDYVLTYENNILAGTAAVVIAGAGKYESYGVTRAEFEIAPLSVNDLIVKENGKEGIADKPYTGQPIYPGNDLTFWYREGTQEYEIRQPYCRAAVLPDADITSAGTGRLLLIGDGVNVKDRRDLTFKIIAKELPSNSVEVPATSLVYNGEEQRPTVIVRDGADILTEGIDYTVSYSNNINAGSATVTVKGKGNFSGEVSKNFQILPYTFQNNGDVILSFPNGITEYPFMGTAGVKPPLNVQLHLGQKVLLLVEGTDYTLTYGSNNTSYDVDVRVTVNGQNNFRGTASTTFHITQHDINADDVYVPVIDNQAFTGSPIIPPLDITCGEYHLQSPRDYVLNFPNGNTNIGEVTMEITGRGGFTGTRVVTFYIGENLEAATVEGLEKAYPYTGKMYEIFAPKPDGLGIVRVTMGDRVLSSGDYKLEYAAGSNGISAGTQTLVLIGLGVYGGRAEKTFEITPKKISDADVEMTGFMEELPYEPQITQKITLKWGDIYLKEGEDKDFTVECAPLRGGTWRMTVKGVNNYAGEIQKNFVVDQKDIGDAEVVNYASVYTYTGEPITPDLRVELGGKRLELNRDYEIVEVKNNVNAGIATILLKGTGNYTGEKEVTFQINRKSIQNVPVGSIPTQIYTGYDIEPGVEVSGLVRDMDYSLMYSDNRKPGTGAAIVTGIGNYTSTKRIPFNIRPGSVSSIAVVATSGSSLTLRWSGEGVVTGYEIYRAGEDGSYVRVARKMVVEDFTDTQITAGKNYSYKVRAYLVTDGEVYYSAFSPVAQGRI